jgi:hypothetical protein
MDLEGDKKDIINREIKFFRDLLAYSEDYFIQLSIYFQCYIFDLTYSISNGHPDLNVILIVILRTRLKFYFNC